MISTVHVNHKNAKKSKVITMKYLLTSTMKKSLSLLGREVRLGEKEILFQRGNL